ncbi:MAG: hypothetical protein CBC12_12290 [Candidatus Puniceispirillum sp. TMED52]|nr:MAG: hypothetical protein CBC12_12290 [Candidatus Puniceispirillum sp. TMED52]OUX75226.1 MAG: hypothetical protein CBC19_11610 [Oceanospirillales bacterium TMED59]
MAVIRSDGELWLSPEELDVLETEFFSFERQVGAIDDEDALSIVLKLKWDYLMLRERLDVLEKDPKIQKRYKTKNKDL